MEFETFKRDMVVLEKEVDSCEKGDDKITVIFPVTSDNFLSAATALLTCDVYIYIHSIYAMQMCL